MKKYLVLFLISLPLFAGPIPKACYKNARSEFSKSVARSIFDPRVSIIQEGMKAHKKNQIRAAMKTANTGKFTYMSKLMAKNVGLSQQEFLTAIQKNPHYFCNKKNKLNSIDEIWWKFTKYKLKPRIDARLKSIVRNCSPQSVITKLKQRGDFDPARFQTILTPKMKDLAIGPKRLLGKIVIGHKYRKNWIYNIENNFTDPLGQNGNDYQYLIHGIRSTHSVGTHKYALVTANKYLNNLDKTSLSLVDEDDTYPFTRGIGILVHMDAKTLWATHIKNMASDHQSLKSLNGSYPIYTPNELLGERRREKITQNNEIVSLKGSNAIGYYLFKNPNTNRVLWYLYDVEKLKVLEDACIKNNLPVININLSGRGYL
jgi:hypothetical protein